MIEPEFPWVPNADSEIKFSSKFSMPFKLISWEETAEAKPIPQDLMEQVRQRVIGGINLRYFPSDLYKCSLCGMPWHQTKQGRIFCLLMKLSLY